MKAQTTKKETPPAAMVDVFGQRTAYKVYEATAKRLAVRIDKDMLHVSIPIIPRPSMTGKRTVVASTDGSRLVDCQYAGYDMRVTLVATCRRS